jgi:hypothetical protein
LKATIQSKHAKGHQGRKSKQLDYEAQFNVEANDVAKESLVLKNIKMNLPKPKAKMFIDNKMIT